MGRKRKIPKKLVVPTTPMVEEPLKIYHTPEAFYLDHLRSLCARAETPTSLVEGKSLDEHACYVRHRISKKGNFSWIKFIVCNAIYAWTLCELYDVACAETPTILVEGKSLDEHACFVRHRISEKGKTYWIKFIVCNAMLGIYVKYMILLVVLKTLRNTFPTNVSLVIMESYLRMLRVFIITMMLNELKNLLLLRLLMKLNLCLKSMKL